MAADVLRRLDIPIEYVIDRSPPPDGLLLGTIAVMRPEQAPVSHHDTHMIVVCVANSPYTPIEESLRAMGWRSIHHFYDISEAYVDRVPMTNGWFTGQLDQEDLERVRWVLGRWYDNPSRAAYLQWLAWRTHRWEWQFSEAKVNLDNRFFIRPMIHALTRHEFFVDAGAYRGAVIEKFLRIAGGGYEGIVAIEPDSQNVARLRANLARLQPAESQSRLHVLECALGARSENRPFFHGLDLASCLAPHASGSVQVRTLDGLDLPVTFIKLHLEGAELGALQGAMATMQKQRPLLTVTLYHNRDGLWKIPALLMQQLPGYRFRLRLHSWCGTGCVLYAIPEERETRRHCHRCGSGPDMGLQEAPAFCAKGTGQDRS